MDRKERDKRYREKNKEKRNEYSKKYYQENLDKIKEYGQDYRTFTKEEKKEYDKKYRQENGDKLKVVKKRQYDYSKYRQNVLKRKYNITLDDYNKMLQEQDGKCWTCSVKAEDTKSKVLVVDHNHLTGEVRGLLCNFCNTAIGLLKESQETIEKVSKYLHEKGSCVLKEVG
jgi:hypothetical protein